MIKEKKGTSPIAITFLVVLIVIIVGVIVWVIINGLGEKTEEEDIDAITLDINIDAIDLYSVTNDACVKVKKELGFAELVSLKFLFYTAIDSEEFIENATLDGLEERIYYPDRWRCTAKW